MVVPVRGRAQQQAIVGCHVANESLVSLQVFSYDRSRWRILRLGGRRRR